MVKPESNLNGKKKLLKTNSKINVIIVLELHYIIFRACQANLKKGRFSSLFPVVRSVPKLSYLSPKGLCLG